jgi:hypothetical protein
MALPEFDSLPVTTNNQLGSQKGAKAGRAGKDISNLKIYQSYYDLKSS